LSEPQPCPGHHLRTHKENTPECRVYQCAAHTLLKAGWIRM
jgi:hypothetical protein